MEASKPIYWVGSSRKDLKAAPDDVRSVIGFALRMAQRGDKHPDAKPLKGFGNGQVLEIVADGERCTYRGVYSVEFEGVVFALHVFQKKSKRGIRTDKADIDLIRARRESAKKIYESHEFSLQELRRRQFAEKGTHHATDQNPARQR